MTTFMLLPEGSEGAGTPFAENLVEWSPAHLSQNELPESLTNLKDPESGLLADGSCSAEVFRAVDDSGYMQYSFVTNGCRVELIGGGSK